MQIILFRHGIAMEHEEAAEKGVKDADRPLTRQGITRTEEAVEGLREQVESLVLVAHSPLLRARQTADVLAATYPAARRAETRALKPGAAADSLAQFVVQQTRGGAAAAVIALVGHEPHLSLWAAWAMAGASQPLFALKKAGACLIEFDGAPRAKAGQLVWLLTAGQLRKLS